MICVVMKVAIISPATDELSQFRACFVIIEGGVPDCGWGARSWPCCGGRGCADDARHPPSFF